MKTGLKRKRWPGRLAAAGISMILGCSSFFAGGFPVQAEEEALITGLEEIMEQSAEQKDSFAPEDGTVPDSSEAKPASFDLRDVNGTNYITPVRQQNPFGTCWGFGAIAAAESSILADGLAAEKGYDVNTLDLSEKQISWFAAQSISDKNNSQYGEGISFLTPVSDKAKYNLGGYTLYATNLFASGVGPVEEQTVTDDGEIFRYKGTEGIVLSRDVTWIDDDGNELSGVKKVFYSEDDNWAIPDEYRFSQTYSLKESYLLPTPSTVEDGDVKVYHPEATEAIKEQLLSNHAVCVSFRADHSQPGDESTEGGYMSDNWSQCILEDDTKPNHVVTIVGYDDEYPKELFRSDSQPPEDGAWLVKNSWGSDLNEFPNNGYRHWGLLEGQDTVGSRGSHPAVSQQHTGYFWLSYYDKSMENPEAYSFETAPEDVTIQQYDFLPVGDYQTYSTETENRMANVFTADANGKLEDVSFFTTTPGTTVRFKVYLMIEDSSKPEDGVCVYESEPKTYAWGGYHKETLDADTNVIVAQGQKYSVVVEEQTPSGKYSISFGQSPAGRTGNVSFHAVMNEGESFLYIDDAWKDLSDTEIQSVLNGGAEGREMDNFPIKAYLAPVENSGIYLSVNGLDPFGETMTILKEGQQQDFEVFFKGGKDSPAGTPAITWESTNTDVFTVEVTDKDNCKARISGKKDGVAYLTVDAGIYGKKIIKVRINKLFIVQSEIAEEDKMMVYTGEPLEARVATVWAETETSDNTTDVQKDVDYTVSYENNVLCGKADVYVTGIGKYNGKDLRNFIIIPQKASIGSTLTGNTSIKVGFASQKASGINGYLLSWTDKSTGKTETKDLGAGATSAVISGLTKGETYQIALKAYVNNPDTDPVWDVEKQEWVDPPLKFYGEEDSVTAKAEKSANPLSVKAKTAAVSYSKVKTKTQTLDVSKVITFTKNGQGTVTYEKVSGNGKITINKKTGTVTVKKGLAKGTYKVKVRIKAAGNKYYKASAVKTVTFRIKVK